MAGANDALLSRPAPLTTALRAVSHTGGHGRGGQSGRIIGDVINHGKHQFWVRARAVTRRKPWGGAALLACVRLRVVCLADTQLVAG